MKKTIKLLIFTLIMSFGFLTGLKAETKTCYYKYSFAGGSSSTEHAFKIQYTYNTTSSFIAKLDENETSFNVGNIPYTIKKATNVEKGNQFINWNILEEDLKNGKCPSVYFYQKNYKGKSGTVSKPLKVEIMLLPGNYASMSSSSTNRLTNVDIEGNDINLSTNANDKTCKYGVSSLSLSGKKQENLTTDDYNGLKTSEFTVISSADGKVYIYYHATGEKTEIVENSAHCNKGNQAWCAKYTSKQNFMLTNEDAETFKKLFSSKRDCPHEIYLEKDVDNFLLKLSKTDKSIILKNNYTIDEDENYHSLVKRIGWFDKLNISDEVGNCIDYVGEDLAGYLQTIFTIIKVVAIILTLVMSMLDLASVMTKNRDELMPTVKKWAQRLIIVIAILLLPTLIDLIGNIAGKEDILCGIK